MTRTAMVITMLLMVSALKASDKKEECYVIVGDNTYYCNEIRMGQGNTRIYSGLSMIKIPTSIIDAYSNDGMLFERLPVVNKNLDTAGWAFMQFISARSGYRLYRYCSNCVHYDPLTGEIAPETPVYRYYIFKDGNFVNMLDENHIKTQLSRFGVKLRS